MKLKTTQKTHVPTQKELAKKWFLIDVKGKTLGLAATKIANILRGKDKPFFTPQHDCGDFVVVLNSKEIRLAGNKMDTKMYYWHTQYPGGIKSRTARQILDRKPDKVLYDAIRGMMPRNRLRKKIMSKLHIFPGTEHTHASQSPVTL